MFSMRYTYHDGNLFFLSQGKAVYHVENGICRGDDEGLCGRQERVFEQLAPYDSLSSCR
jgi:hypothetical protein